MPEFSYGLALSDPQVRTAVPDVAEYWETLTVDPRACRRPRRIEQLVHLVCTQIQQEASRGATAHT